MSDRLTWKHLMHTRLDYDEVSLFTAGNLLKEARRQKGLGSHPVPPVCILDPDGDIVKYLQQGNSAVRNAFWPCYHTELYNFNLGEQAVGIIGNAVGSPFAVLVAEELFALGCKLIVSITSAGKLDNGDPATRFILIAKSLRDEGTSRNYQPASLFSALDSQLLATLSSRAGASPVPFRIGTSWTTDAPFRETQSAIKFASNHSADCVEMESAALYAFAQFVKMPVICLAHLTNSTSRSEGNFDKGVENGSIESLKLIEYVLKCVYPNPENVR